VSLEHLKASNIIDYTITLPQSIAADDSPDSSCTPCVTKNGAAFHATLDIYSFCDATRKKNEQVTVPIIPSRKSEFLNIEILAIHEITAHWSDEPALISGYF